MMRVSLPTKPLSDVLSQLERIIPQRSSNPALSLLRMELAEQTLILSGSNMELDMRAHLAADVDSTGVLALPASVFHQVVRALPDEVLTLEAEGNELSIRSGSYQTQLQLSEVSDDLSLHFPAEDAYNASVNAHHLHQALQHVRYAAAIAEYQGVMRGVKLELADAKTRAIATNGFRLAYYHQELSSGMAGEMVIPAKSVDEIIRIFDTGEVKLLLEANTLHLHNPSYSLNVQLMEGEFPNYNAVIPQDFALRVRLEASMLRDSIQRVALMAEKSSNNRIDVFIQQGTMRLSAEGSYGRSQESLEVSQEGREAEMLLAYNASFLLEALRPSKGEIYLAFPSPTAPTVLTSAEDAGYLAMIVPLSL